MSYHEPGNESLMVHGGDPLASDGPADHYLDDIWRLTLPNKFHPVWTHLNTTDKNGTGTSLIHGNNVNKSSSSPQA